jgi:hypothetical protein
VTTAPPLHLGVSWRRNTTCNKAVRQFLAVVDELARGARPRLDRSNGHVALHTACQNSSAVADVAVTGSYR